MSDNVELGRRYRDIRNSLEGIAVSKLIHLDGLIEYGIMPHQKGGQAKDIQYIHSSYLEYIDGGIINAGVQKGEFGFNSNTGIPRPKPNLTKRINEI